MPQDPAATKRQFDQHKQSSANPNAGNSLPGWATSEVIQSDISGTQANRLTEDLKALLDQLEYVTPTNSKKAKIDYLEKVTKALSGVYAMRMVAVSSSSTLTDSQKDERLSDIKFELKARILDVADSLGSFNEAEADKINV